MTFNREEIVGEVGLHSTCPVAAAYYWMLLDTTALHLPTGHRRRRTVQFKAVVPIVLQYNALEGFATELGAVQDFGRKAMQMLYKAVQGCSTNATWS